MAYFILTYTLTLYFDITIDLIMSIKYSVIRLTCKSLTLIPLIAIQQI